MELSQEEKQRIRSSYARIAGMQAKAGLMFYDRLFEKDPSLKAMFHRAPIETQAAKLMQVIGFVVERLDRVPETKGELVSLGRKHVDYGVTVDHYALVGAALVWTMKQCLGNDFDADTEAAWIELYTYLSGEMEP